ncbi:LysE family translocator [Pantoea ananatis]|uniref:Threonine efflux protein n=1 Tax=Pantoea ananas TaxID=553 RepID=A0AAJ1CXV3_PANAN|nr:LysE family transporter [Pantoea ananatis]KGL57923.1 RhtC [Pantoea ananatis]MCW0307632.1 Threonine efflux protein [Pantoea ananatis]MCW0312976.1 Threonine efflux protein [Pantoea ananatis]MCW0339632.1 Threonine efflux protein [Pantoea ananatis]MCW0343622.1 Threonine efflux protein [Pantoea ananatis]
MEINLTGFLPALLPIALSPGASFTLAMNSALTAGRKGLVKTLLGTALGIYTHALLIGLGLSTALVTSPALFALLKIAGVLYLFWLGGLLLITGVRTRAFVLRTTGRATTVKGAWLANVANPKAVLFYLTVVSQFVGDRAGIDAFLTLATVHIVVMSLWLALFSQALVFSAQKINPVALKRYVNIGGGLLLIGIALRTLIA